MDDQELRESATRLQARFRDDKRRMDAFFTSPRTSGPPPVVSIEPFVELTDLLVEVVDRLTGAGGPPDVINRAALGVRAETLRSTSIDELGRQAGAVTGELQYRAEGKIAVYLVTELVQAAFSAHAHT